jgi:hypothetical protein
MSQDTVETIVRFHNPASFPELSAALMSLIAQSWRPLRVLLVTQRFTPDQLEALDIALAPYRAIDPSAEIVVVPYARRDGLADARSALVNAAIEQARGRYIGVLDYDDTMYPDAYETLVRELQARGCAVACGGIAMKGVAMSAAVPLGIAYARSGRSFGHGLIDTFRQNFCPFHGMLFDRTRIRAEDLRLDEGLPIYEDYEWQLRLGARYPVSYAMINRIIGDYRYRDDGSNTTVMRYEADAQKRNLWALWSADIEARRARIEVAPAIQARLGIDPVRPGLTIRLLLDLVDQGEIVPSEQPILVPRVTPYNPAEVMP